MSCQLVSSRIACPVSFVLSASNQKQRMTLRSRPASRRTPVSFRRFCWLQGFMLVHAFSIATNALAEDATRSVFIRKGVSPPSMLMSDAAVADERWYSAHPHRPNKPKGRANLFSRPAQSTGIAILTRADAYDRNHDRDRANPAKPGYRSIAGLSHRRTILCHCVNSR
jgi:hypothetical protein